MAFRKPLKITSRTSSVTNSFVQAIVPHVVPTAAEIDEALHVLGMTQGNRVCVYCGMPATDWDHLRPMVRGKRPTGFIDEIRNLVPSCGPCNQSKGASEWRRWMEGSPLARVHSEVQMKELTRTKRGHGARFWVHGFCTDLFSVWLRFTPFGSASGSRGVPRNPPETTDFIG